MIVSDQVPTIGLVMQEPLAPVIGAGLGDPARLYWFEWTKLGLSVEFVPHLPKANKIKLFS